MALDAQYSQDRAGKGDQGTPSLRALGPASQGDPHPPPPWTARQRSLPPLPESAHSLPASAQENATRVRMWTQRASVARCLQPPWALPEEGKTWQDTKRNPGPTAQPHPGLWGQGTTRSKTIWERSGLPGKAAHTRTSSDFTGAAPAGSPPQGRRGGYRGSKPAPDLWRPWDRRPLGLYKAHPALAATEPAQKMGFIHQPPPDSCARGGGGQDPAQSLPAGPLLHHHRLRQGLLLKLPNQLLHVDLEQRARVLQERDGVTVSCSGEAGTQLLLAKHQGERGPSGLAYSHQPRGQPCP